MQANTDHSFSGADDDIDGVHFVLVEGALLMLLALRLAGILYNRFLAIDFELLQLVAEHALNGLALVRLADLLHSIGDGVILNQTDKKLFKLVTNSIQNETICN